MDRLRARTLFSNQRLTVAAVESLDFQAGRSNQRTFLIGSLKPIAILVTESDRTYALGMDAQPVDIDRLDLPADFEL